MSTSPDCRDNNNHHKCDGTAWDLDTDQVTTCDCPHHQDHGSEAALEPGPPWKLLGTTPSGFKVYTAPVGTAPRISER